jgi:DNA polymerase III subunit beta
MRFTAPAGILHAAFAAAARAVDTKSAARIPVLGAVLIEADGNSAVVRGSDLHTEVAVEFAAQVDEMGAVALDSRIVDLVAALPASDNVIVAAADGAATASVRCGRRSYKPGALRPQDFPQSLAIDPATPHCAFSLPAADAVALFGLLLFAVSDEATRYYLCGVHMHPGAEGLIGVATDSTLLATLTVEMPSIAGEWPRDIIVPRRTCERFLRLAKAKGDIRLRISSSRIECAADGQVIVSKLIDACFPDYQRVIPKPAAVTGAAEVDAAELSRAVERLDAISDHDIGKHIAHLEWDDSGDALRLSLPRAGEGAADDTIDAKIEGGATTKVGFNCAITKLRTVIEQIDGKRVLLRPTEQHGPILITDPADRRYFSLVMPTR